MRLYDIPEVKWILLAIFLAVFGLKVYFAPTNLIDILIVGSSVALYIIALLVHYSSTSRPQVIWDESRGIVAIIRSWSVEVNSARILSSVPIGIDLSHSGRKVLQSMYSRFSNEAGGTLVFFITRPIGNQSTRVGILVRRRGLRHWNGMRTVDSLAEKLATDTMILERSMRAAYPHLPVTEACFQDIIRTTSGGLETYVLS